MNREYRLTSSTEIKRVRRNGISYAHPLVVLITAPNEQGLTRFGVIAGRTVGNAVRRNRAKRRLRAVILNLLPQIRSGSDTLLIARQDSVESQWSDLYQAVEGLCYRAGLLDER